MCYYDCFRTAHYYVARPDIIGLMWIDKQELYKLVPSKSGVTSVELAQILMPHSPNGFEDGKENPANWVQHFALIKPLPSHDASQVHRTNKHLQVKETERRRTEEDL
eukprot:scaffold253891_cov18-Prasinocladus_malaysianus.AAC.2